mgnify:FL=1
MGVYLREGRHPFLCMLANLFRFPYVLTTQDHPYIYLSVKKNESTRYLFAYLPRAELRW